MPATISRTQTTLLTSRGSPRIKTGSVSKKIAEEANCAVRVARGGFEKDADARTEIVAGASSLPDVEN